MEIKTSDSYLKEVLAKYKSDKGGVMSMYLAQPTSSQIRQACIWLLDKRNDKHDELILNRFFQFKNQENKIKEIQNFDEGKFKPLVNFLTGKTKRTSPKNLELISWLIDFQSRPYEEYLKSESSVSEEESLSESNSLIIPESESESTKGDNELEQNKKEEESSKKDEKRKRRRRIITISISIAFGMALIIVGIQKWYPGDKIHKPEGEKCMTWADSLYVTISCDTGPSSEYGTKVEPLDQRRLKNMRKVEVYAAYNFFTKEGKPLIWYYKNENNEHEFFTAPGLHPVTDETLKKITPYIIQTYVPLHTEKKSSFVQ